MSLGSIIDQIKQYPLSEVIGHYIPVRKEGTGHAALCPFHGDTKPSLKIADNKQLFKCFACGHAGDHISFVQDYKNIEFIEAVKEIAGQFSIPTDSLDKGKKKDPKEEMAFRVLTSANKLYRKYASTHHQKEFQEFLESRGLDEEVAESFGIGFAPKGGVFYKYLQSIPSDNKDMALKVAQEIGIIKQGNNGLYDAFRDRITFPVRDQYGQVRSFSCRATREGQEPKYLHLKESFIFHKRNILFGLDVAKSNIRQKDSVIVCEGNMDAIALHQYGFNQAVATMGVALTDFAIQRLKSMTKNFYLAMDNDKAGFNAMERINNDLLGHGIYPKYIDLSPSKDPDDFLKEHGRLAFVERMDEAKTFIDVLIETKLPETIPDNPDQKHQILVGEIFPILAPLKESLMATERVVETAKKLGFKSDSTVLLNSYNQFLEDLKKQQSRYNKPPQAVMAKKTQPQPQAQGANDLKQNETKLSESPKLATQSVKPQELSKTDKLLLKELFQYPQAFSSVTEGKLLDFVGSNEVKKLIQWVSKLYLEVDDKEFINVVRNSLTTSEFSHLLKETVSSILFSVEPSTASEEVIMRLLSDIENRMEIGRLKDKRRELLEEQRTLPQDQAMEILVKINELDKQLIQLKDKKNKTN